MDGQIGLANRFGISLILKIIIATHQLFIFFSIIVIIVIPKEVTALRTKKESEGVMTSPSCYFYCA
ncbi:hypothetical protein DSOL_2557 [Desulfosporosinus metallidurans]|uniref:Uncharacterized protein n=1 Tax=Desulfosporosinus metallidurans TaxID=1888891 RepID=A0A1Q8QW43_9FIRM|nr:hypothetical protein DSOL_2557 [Desulfosporosinus metallidurans]